MSLEGDQDESWLIIFGHGKTKDRKQNKMWKNNEHMPTLQNLRPLYEDLWTQEIQFTSM